MMKGMDMDDVYDVILVPYECGNVASYYLAERTVMDNLDIGNGSFSRQYEYAYVVKDGYYLCIIWGEILHHHHLHISILPCCKALIASRAITVETTLSNVD